MKLIAAISLLAAGVSLNACSNPNPRWSERVHLSDGQIVVVHRETLYERGGDEWAANRSLVKPREYRIRFVWPEGTGQHIEWKSTKKDSQAWPEDPLILDIEAGYPVVYTVIHVSPACEVYLRYRYADGVWKEEDLPSRFEQRTTNLLLKSGVEMPESVTLEEKRVDIAEPGYRRSLVQIGPNRRVCG